MTTLLINPPYQTLTSNLGVGHQVPLGLLMVGGALLDAGFNVRLLDAEAMHLTDIQIAERVADIGPVSVMTGHAGSTPAHPVCMSMLRAIRARCPRVRTIYGGVFPTYHDMTILRQESAVDVIVRGEGEAVAVALTRATNDDADLRPIQGITFRDQTGRVVRIADAPSIRDLEQYRVGWELIDNWDRYQCFGLGRAAIVQFSRGCPHRCTYCGQHGFWRSWRHRDADAFADEIAMLHDRHGVRFITLADENPTTNQAHWRRLLKAVVARKEAARREIQFFATIRATDIVRDTEFLDLYRRAGILYVLLGIDATDPRLIVSTRKRSHMSIDEHACHLLRSHDIRSVIAHIVGLGEDTWASFRGALQVLTRYDGDLLNVMYATPHMWTQFAREAAARPIVQDNQRYWDYRHQVLGERHLRPWQLFVAVKWLELAFHLRPRALWRMMIEGDARMRRQRWWTMLHIGLVWIGEIAEFVFCARFAKQPRPLNQMKRCATLEQQTSESPATRVANLHGGGRVSSHLFRIPVTLPARSQPSAQTESA